MAIRQTKKNKEFVDKALLHLQRVGNDMDDFMTNAEDSIKAYNREPYGTEVNGRSSFVTSDVADTIEWILPTLMQLFTGGTEVASAQPQGPEDEESAKAMTKKINFDFMQQQNGYIVLHDWLKSALMNKYSGVKYWWEEGVEKVRAEWDGLEPQEAEAMKNDPEVAVTETFLDADTGLINLKGYDLRKYSRPRSMVVPTEELLFDLYGKDNLEECDFVAHKKRIHKNKLKSKYKLTDKDIGDQKGTFETYEILQDIRLKDLGGGAFVSDKGDDDFYYIYECYMNDYDKQGIKIPMKVVVFGEKAIEVEENTYGKPPFAGLTAIRMPFRAAGLSVFDLVGDIQKIRTSLMRAIMDNIYYQNNGINVVNPYRINMDDVLNRKEPGATWRTLHDIDPQSGITPVMSNPLAPHTMQMLDTVDQMGAKRTGVSVQQGNGLDGGMLANAKSNAVSQVLTEAKSRIELIARTFAETGVKELFTAYSQMNVRWGDDEINVRFDEKWETIRKADLDGLYDIEIESGVGTGQKEMKVQQINTMLQSLAPFLQLGYTDVISKENLYNSVTTMYDLMGWKNPDKFATNPGKVSPQQEQEQQQMQQQMQQMEQELQRLQKELEDKQTEYQLDAEKLRISEEDNQMGHSIDEKALQLKYKVDTDKIELETVKTVASLRQEQKEPKGDK
jgi:hypothetical protein